MLQPSVGEDTTIESSLIQYNRLYINLLRELLSWNVITINTFTHSSSEMQPSKNKVLGGVLVTLSEALLCLIYV